MEKKIILDDTELFEMDSAKTPAGAVAVAVAVKRPNVQQLPGEPNTSPCWLAAVVATDNRRDVDKVRAEFATAAKIDPKELKNVITLKTQQEYDAIGEILQQLMTGPPNFAGINFSLFSCSVGGKGTRVLTGAATKPNFFAATWGLAKGIKKGDDCLCREIKVWTRALTPEEVYEFNAEVATFDGFKCDG